MSSKNNKAPYRGEDVVLETIRSKSKTNELTWDETCEVCAEAAESQGLTSTAAAYRSHKA